MLFRLKKKSSREVSLQDPIGTDKEGNEINLLDVLEGESVDVVAQMELERHIGQLYELLKNTLTDREKDILIMRYGLYGTKELTQREIAKRLGISRSYVSRIEKNAVEKLRVQFQEEIEEG